MDVRETSLPGVLVLEPRVFQDTRGFFVETYHQQRYAEAGVGETFVQDNLSRSVKGTLRGLHYQIQQPQAKLVQALRGAIYDVVVDLRRSSPAFGKWFGIELSESNRRQLFVPRGLAHGFCVLTETADFFYKCSDFYAPQHERTLLWNDSEIAVSWPLDGEPILSEKDRKGIPFASAECYDA